MAERKQGLLLKRKSSESIHIIVNDHESVKITFEKCSQNYVKVRIEAPKTYRIWRSELLTMYSNAFALVRGLFTFTTRPSKSLVSVSQDVLETDSIDSDFTQLTA